MNKRQKTEESIFDRSQSKKKAALKAAKKAKKEDLSSSSGFRLAGKKRSNFAAAGALIATVGLMVIGSSDSPFERASQALVEVKNEEMLPAALDNLTTTSPATSSRMLSSKESTFTNDIAFSHIDHYSELDFESKSLVPQKKFLPPPTTSSSKHHFSLEEAYLAFDVRDSYLQRQSSPLANSAESIILQTDDFETETHNMWRTKDMTTYPFASNELEYYTESNEDRRGYLEKYTQSLYSPTANVIVPRNPRKAECSADGIVDDDTEFDLVETSGTQKSKADVILEADKEGNSYLHLVLPADRINFLNGSDSSSFFDPSFNQTNFGNDDYDAMLIEVGCKVYEVNKIMYRSQPGASQKHNTDFAA